MNSAKRRIVLAVTLAEPGGVQQFLLGFARWLQKHDWDVTVIAGDGEWLFARCRSAGIRAIQLRHMGRSIRPWRDLRAFFELRRVFRDLAPDAIHLNSTKMGVLGSLAARRSATRIVYRIGGWTFLEPLSPLTRRLYLWAEKISARWKDVIICVHPGDMEIASMLGIRPRGRVITVPNGIDLAAFDAALLPRDAARHLLSDVSRFTFHDSPFVFGTIAGFYPAKNLLGYLDACAIVHRENPLARFVIVSDGPERAMFERKRRALGLDDAVITPGVITDAFRVLPAFDAFVLPSLKEGMPWALLEAMAARVPCIATDVGANRWMLTEEGGWIVPSNDVRTLVRAMTEIMRFPDDAKRRAEVARRQVEERFPLEATYRGNEQPLVRKENLE